MQVSINGIMRELPPQKPDEKPATAEQLFKYAFCWFCASIIISLVFKLLVLIFKSKGM